MSLIWGPLFVRLYLTRIDQMQEVCHPNPPFPDYCNSSEYIWCIIPAEKDGRSVKRSPRLTAGRMAPHVAGVDIKGQLSSLHSSAS